MELCFLILASGIAVRGSTNVSYTNVTSASTTPQMSASTTPQMSASTTPQMSASTMLPNITTEETPAPTNATPTTLPCQNGGFEINGFCLCPDGFTGEFCQLSNICPETTIKIFTFPKTFIEQAAYSKQLCPLGNPNAGFPKATAWCMSTNNFTIPQELECSLNLDTINSNLSTASPEARKQLAFNTQILTSRADKITKLNISTAARIVNTLLTNTDSSQEVQRSAVITISQLLNASREQFHDISSDSITSLIQTLPKFSLSPISKGAALIQPNIAILSFKLSSSNKIQVTLFSALNDGHQPSENSQDSLSANRIKMNNTFLPPSEQAPIDVQINMKLKEVGHAVKTATTGQQDDDTNIGFVLYNNDQFFSSRVFQPSLNIKRRVITGHLKKENVLDFVNFTLKEQSGSSMRLNDFACVWWDFAVQDWSITGCKKVWSSTGRTCQCEASQHLANFAMLMSFRSNPEIIQDLGMISMIGCSLSVLGLTLTAIFQILTRKSRKSGPTVLMVSICACMTVVYLLFIFGIKNSALSFSSAVSEENIVPQSDFHRDPDYGPCTVFTALLHYFLLAAFTWSTLYAAHIYLLIRNAVSGPPQYFSVLSVVLGWGIPAVVVGITLGITYRMDNPLDYRQELLCWLAAVDQDYRFDKRKPMLWGFLLPVAVMLLFNTAVLFYFSYTTCRTDPDLNSSHVTPLRNKMLGCMSMAAVLSLSWIIGYFMLLETRDVMHTVLSFAFCLCNTTQGIQIFVLFTLRTSAFKKRALAVLRIFPSPSLSRHRKRFDLRAKQGANIDENYRSVNFNAHMP